jgi:hypothetical protein
MNIFGWAMLGFGMIFVWAFVMNSELVSLFRFAGELGVAEGTIERVETTSASENEVPILRVVYGYTVGDRRLQGTSYTVDGATPGAPIEVEYRHDDPSTSRARGMRSETFPIWVVFVLIFPIVGLAFVVAGVRSGLRAIQLLEHGQLAHGKLVAKEPTNTRINHQTVYELTFEFEDDARRVRRAKARSHRPQILEDEAQEPLLYDPNSDHAVMLDGLPGGPHVDSGGDLVSRNAALAPAVLLLPAITVVVHGGYALFLLA